VRQLPHDRGVRGGGVPAVGSRCIATPSEDVEKTARVIVSCKVCELEKRL
jgi:hypothetical protein